MRADKIPQETDISVGKAIILGSPIEAQRSINEGMTGPRKVGGDTRESADPEEELGLGQRDRRVRFGSQLLNDILIFGRVAL